MTKTSFYLFLAVLFWGFSYIAIKVCLTELEPVEMISARLLMASPVLYIIARLTGRSIWVKEKRVKLGFAALVVFLHFWVMATGMKDTSASNTAWILTTAPIFIALLSWFALKEPFTLWQWLGLAIACAGVFALVSNGKLENLGWIKSRGDLIVLGSCVTWAFYTVGVRDITRAVDPLVTTFWISTLAGVVFVPYTLFTTGVHKYLTLQGTTVFALVFLGVCCFALAFWLWSEGLRRQPAGEVGVYLYLEPLFAMIGGWMILHEPVTIWLFIGAALISLGVYLSEKFGRMKLVEHDA